MKSEAKNIYEMHHAERNKIGFSIIEEFRGRLFSGWIGTGKKVLDLGCRDGTLTRYFSKGNDVLGVDVDEKALSIAKKQLEIRTMAIDLNGDWRMEEKFDVIVMGEVLEHLFFPNKVLDKVVERLEDGGYFIGSVPNAFSLKNRLRYLLGRKKNTPLEDPTHINQFSYEELRELFEKRFSSVEIVPYVRKPFDLLSRVSPSLIAFLFIWKCKK